MPSRKGHNRGHTSNNCPFTYYPLDGVVTSTTKFIVWLWSVMLPNSVTTRSNCLSVDIASGKNLFSMAYKLGGR